MTALMYKLINRWSKTTEKTHSTHLHLPSPRRYASSQDVDCVTVAILSDGPVIPSPFNTGTDIDTSGVTVAVPLGLELNR